MGCWSRQGSNILLLQCMSPINALIPLTIYILYRIYNVTVATSDVVVVRKFRPFVLTKLRKQYSIVIGRLISIFREKEIDIEKLITILRFDDVDKNTIFSTDSVFNSYH